MVRRDILILIAAVLLLRIPFLNQAIQGDDSTFLACAAHAQVDPLHPNHTHYVFTPAELNVDLRGGAHMPVVAWALAGLIAIFGEVREVPFHAAFILFSLMAVLAAYSLALRFSPRPLWAALLFLAVPAFVNNGGSFEADVPHVAFFLCGIATFIAAADRRATALLGPSAFFLGCAALTVMQAQVAAPILLVYVWLFARDWKPAWFAAFAPCLTLAAWEVFERVTSGDFPFAMMQRNVHERGWDALSPKLLSAAALAMHLWFIVFPILFALGIWAACRRRDRDTAFLALWIVIYVAAACVAFFSGSARYLLPVAVPVAIWASYAPKPWLIGGFAAQMALSLCLAVANYQHWDAYREFARDVVKQASGRRIWINSEWGLRHYMEDAGARVPKPGQRIPSGDIVVWSKLVHPVAIEHPGAISASLLERDVRPWMPFRLIGIESYTGYSTIDNGFAPFGIGDDLVDQIHADIYKEVTPTLQDLPMNAPEAESQILSGLFELQNGIERWTSGEASVSLVSPTEPKPLHAQFYVPDNAAARQATLLLDGRPVQTENIGPGKHRIVTRPQQASGPTCVVSLKVDKTFSAPGDARHLGVVLQGIGWGR